MIRADEIDFESFDFKGRKPKHNSPIKWFSRLKFRRKNGACTGRFVGIDSDGWFLVKYVWGGPGDYKDRTIRVEPRFVIDCGELE